MIETVRTIARPQAARRSVAAAPVSGNGPFTITPVQAAVIFENTPRTSLEDFVLLAEAAEEEEAPTGRMPEAVFTPRGVSPARYATPPAGTKQQ